MGQNGGGRGIWPPFLHPARMLSWNVVVSLPRNGLYVWATCRTSTKWNTAHNQSTTGTALYIRSKPAPKTTNELPELPPISTNQNRSFQPIKIRPFQPIRRKHCPPNPFPLLAFWTVKGIFRYLSRVLTAVAGRHLNNFMCLCRVSI